MEGTEPPPTTHTLRPHHLGLLMIIMLVIKHIERTPENNAFIMQVLRVLIYEIAEVSRPKTYAQLITLFHILPHSNDVGAQQFFESTRPLYMDFVSVDHLANFFASISYLVQDINKSPSQSDLARRSLFGYFCRRCSITYQKMSYSGIVFLLSDYHEWLLGHPTAGYHQVKKDMITYDLLIHKTHADECQWAVADPYAVFERGLAISDTNVASESLRRFFEQHFHDASDSGLRQHALLNLARMHYLHNEFTAARKYLVEAIDVSRIASDKETLQHCQSLSNRLPPTVRGGRQALNEIQPGIHPLEVLFDVEKLLRVSQEQPLSAAFEKIAQAIGLYDHWIDVQQNIPEDSEQWGHHAVQSIVWSAAGCDRLAAIEENIVTAFTEVAGDDNCAITVALNRAYRRARQGLYQESIAALLEPDVWRGLSMDDYVKWATEIWNILVLRASRRGQDRQYTDFLKTRMPSGPFNPRSYFFNVPAPPESIIRDPLHEVMRMRHVDQAAISIERLLKALWHTEFQCRYGSYRTGIILLADIGLEFGMTKRSRRIVEEIMPQVITGNDLEQRAFACFTYARCIVAAGNKSAESIREAIPYIEIAENDYRTIQILRSLADVQYYLAVLYHNLGMEAERDAAAERHEKTEEERKEAAVCGIEGWVKDVWDLVCEIGTVLAAR